MAVGVAEVEGGPEHWGEAPGPGPERGVVLSFCFIPGAGTKEDGPSFLLIPGSLPPEILSLG